ncbi:hypothetical protein AYX22_17150 [Arthrobacter sp. D5-1]|nr:hypothetical protein AYX22_17150 [Arthrobacter sp. D5-1]
MDKGQNPLGNGCCSAQFQHHISGLICENPVGAQGVGARGGAPCLEFESVLMKGAHHHLLVDGAVRDRAAFVRADTRDGPQVSIPQAEHRHLLAVDSKRPAFTERNLVNGTKDAMGLRSSGRY